jgi:two-component system, chemotaxis family, CheB/CheR fusion protein
MSETSAKPTILCIDDEAPGLYFRSLILEQHGYRVLTAASASEGFEVFKSNDVDLVVTDHLLGRGTGTKMAADMRRLKPAVPIIILSGTTEVPGGLENADAFLSKTEGPARLLSQVEILLLKRQPGNQKTAEVSPPTPSSVSSEGTQALLAAIVESSDDAIFSKTLDGIITSWNPAAQRMYGYARDEAVGKSVTILFPPDRPNEFNDIMSRLRRGEQIEHYETNRITKDGRRLTVSLTISPLRGSDGSVVGASTIARDVTKLKMAEEALRNSEKLAVAGRMAATVAHEINNPLEAVTNILYLLESSKSLDDKARKFVGAAQEEVKRISQITKLTLGFYRNWERKHAPVKVTELIDNLLVLYSRKIESLGITILKRYRSEGTVTGDPGELRQVFSNLIVNAMDALTHSGDCLRITVRDASDWKDGRRAGVRTVISDNGPGIQMSDRMRIFEPFYTTKGEAGTGVGLWVSRGIIEKHGGSVTFKSHVAPRRSGTVFSVFLPLVPNSEAGP